MAWYDDILGSGVNIFGAAPPSYLGGEGGLLNPAEMDKLKQKSLISGLLNTGLTYLAQPKNQRYGSALPYLAKAGIAGVGASQNVYDQASQDYITKAKIEELQAGKTYATQLLNDPRVKGRPELEMMARKDPAKLFEFLNPKAEIKEVNGQLVSYNPSTQAATPIFGTPKVDTVEVDRGDRIDLVNKSTGILVSSYPKNAAPKNEEMYETKPTLDNNGQTIYLPTVYGAKKNMPVLDMQGKPVANYVPVTKPMSESQANANIFAPRADEANKTLKLLEVTDKSGQLQYSPLKLNQKLTAQNTIGIGAPIGALANKYYLGENEQKAEQAQRDFVNAVLRKESGAAISQSEFDNAMKQYFPQYGDSKAQIAQKQKSRDLEIKGLYEATGKVIPSQNKSNIIDFKDL